MGGAQSHRIMAVWVFSLVLISVVLTPVTAQTSERRLINWDDMVPSGSTSSQPALGENEQVRPSKPSVGHDADRYDPLMADGTQEDPWQVQSVDVTTSLLNQDILIDGYVLPLIWDGQRVLEFLLVPWIGACIHTPAPPPNQMIHVSYPEGLSLKKPFEPVRLAGALKHEPSAHLLFLVDGSRPVQASYVLEDARVSGSPGDIVAASASEVPVLTRLQIWANTLFTDSMRALGEGGSTRSLLFALLLSFGYGALHTLGPGHGKTVVVSYFVGTGGSLRRGVTMGVRIAVFHVLSAVVVVFLLDFVVRQTTGAAPADYRAIRLASYGLIIAIGLSMLWQAASAIRARRAEAAYGQAALVGANSHHGQRDHHHESAAHAHHGHSHVGCTACAVAADPKGSTWVAASVGLVPCTGALIVMLFGLANDLVWPAILMVAAISAGMAIAMSAIGVTALWGRRWAERNLGGGADRRVRFELGARLAGAVCVLAIGIILFGVTLTLEPMAAISGSEIALQSNGEIDVGG